MSEWIIGWVVAVVVVLFVLARSGPKRLEDQELEDLDWEEPFYQCEKCKRRLHMGGEHEKGCTHNMVHHDKEGWWFHDETWADRYGPFGTQSECLAVLDEYMRDVILGKGTKFLAEDEEKL
jgi:hypothetical protein